MIEYEKPFWDRGLWVAGVDEAGRGPLAGPVVACAVILPPYSQIPIDRDSKRMAPKEREEAYELIKSHALAIGTAVVDSAVVDRLNIRRATELAMRRALEDLKHAFDVVITDYVRLEGYTCLPLVKGDEKSLSCACASIVAKVLRDRVMEHYHKVFPKYGFIKHKGYPTKEHMERLKELGSSIIHRKSFAPVKSLL